MVLVPYMWASMTFLLKSIVQKGRPSTSSQTIYDNLENLIVFFIVFLLSF